MLNQPTAPKTVGDFLDADTLKALHENLQEARNQLVWAQYYTSSSPIELPGHRSLPSKLALVYEILDAAVTVVGAVVTGQENDL